MINVQLMMCNARGCTRREQCYRYRAKPVKPPRQQLYHRFNPGQSGCKYFMPLHARTELLALADADKRAAACA